MLTDGACGVVGSDSAWHESGSGGCGGRCLSPSSSPRSSASRKLPNRPLSSATAPRTALSADAGPPLTISGAGGAHVSTRETSTLSAWTSSCRSGSTSQPWYQSAPRTSGHSPHWLARRLRHQSRTPQAACVRWAIHHERVTTRAAQSASPPCAVAARAPRACIARRTISNSWSRSDSVASRWSISSQSRHWASMAASRRQSAAW